jgi:hypothetical protein
VSFTKGFDFGGALKNLVSDSSLAEEETHHQAADSGPDHDYTGIGVLLAVRHFSVAVVAVAVVVCSCVY